MSAEFEESKVSKVETLESAKSIRARLQERFKIELLDRVGVISEIGVYEHEYEPMSEIFSSKEGVSQTLECVIKAGNEFFCVVNSNVQSETDGSHQVNTLLTRHIAGGRAELMDIIEENSALSIGRSSENELDKTVSRSHFSIAKREDGLIGITDNGSTNHTEVFSSKQKGKNIFEEIDTANPLYDKNFWSIKSEELKNIVNGSKQPKAKS